MIDELKIFFDAVSGATTLAAWLAGGFILAYALIYGAIIFCVGYCISIIATKWHDYGVADRVVTKRVVHTYDEILSTDQRVDRICITSGGDVTEQLFVQLRRLRNKGTHITGSGYIHDSSVEWLAAAIDLMESSDKEKEKEDE